MKKTFFSLALVAMSTLGFAQSETMEAFKHVGVGLEVGLMGAGVQVSMPVVTDHLVLVVGCNFPQLTYGTTIDVDSKELRSKIDDLNGSINRYNQIPGKHIDNLSYPNKDISLDVDAKLNLGAFKALVEYYPWQNHSFHLTAGMYIGKEDFISLSGSAEQEWWSVYQKAVDINNNQLPANMKVDGMDEAVKFNIDEQTFQVKPSGTGELELNIVTKKVKPYVGIGFGRPIPTKRVGFQFELGAWMHGTPTIKSAQEIAYQSGTAGIDGVGDVMSKITVYPQMTFRLTGRIF